MAMERTITVAPREQFYFPVVIDQSQEPFQNEPDGVAKIQSTRATEGNPPAEFVTLLKDIVERRRTAPRGV